MLTIALLISASGVDACVPTHGASMNMCLVPDKVGGSDAPLSAQPCPVLPIFPFAPVGITEIVFLPNFRTRGSSPP